MHKQDQGGRLDAVVEPFFCVVKQANTAVSVHVHVQYPAARCFLLAQVCKAGLACSKSSRALSNSCLRTKYR